MAQRKGAERDVIDPLNLEFTDDAPPPQTSAAGGGYSPYAKIVTALMTKPGKWGRFPKSSRKAENIHRKFPGIERRSDPVNDVLWLRFVTAPIIAGEAISTGKLNLESDDYAAAVKTVTDAAQTAGETSAKYNEDNTVKLTEFYVPAMQDAAKVAVIGLRIAATKELGDSEE